MRSTIRSFSTACLLLAATFGSRAGTAGARGRPGLAMRRAALLACASLSVLPASAPPAAAQGGLRERLRPVTAEVRHAGVLHLGTGRWTRRVSPDQAGPGVLYANTCESGYFLAMRQGEAVVDEGALPADGMPVTPSAQIAGGYDAWPGCTRCDQTYAVNGFQIAYCSNSATFDVTIAFFSAYQDPGVACTVPGAPTASFPVTGLPAANPSACWIVAFDLGAASSTFSLKATDGGADGSAFGWSFRLDSAPASPQTDGPLLAGGRPVGASYADCTGTDATKWDHGTASVAWPGNVVQVGNFPRTLEQGTGMLTQDAFRLDPAVAPQAPGCYAFGGNPLASFHLELYWDPVCPACTLGTSLCLPGTGGVVPCPCGNPPTNPGAGCDNSGQGQPATGGGWLSASSPSGAASVGNDQVHLLAQSVRANTTSLFLQGDALIAQGIVFGDGVRCAGGNLLRLNSPGGTPSDAQGSVSYPNAGFPLPITRRAAALGQPIAAGSTRWYQTYYRDPSATFCPAPVGDTWNVTQALAIAWAP